MSTTKIKCRWGIMGMGTISNWFIGDLFHSGKRENTNISHTIAAVASSSAEKARKSLNIIAPELKPTIYTSYNELVKDSSLDVIYIATPHGVHYEHIKLCLENGKNALCEKPFTINARQSKELIALAKEKDLFLMEGLWTRFFPLTIELQKKVFEEKIIGTPVRLQCDFSLPMPVRDLVEGNRLSDPTLGAGALLDLGVYPVTWARLLLGDHPDNKGAEPQISSGMILTDTGVDESTAVTLTYPNLRASAICLSALTCKFPVEFLRLEGSNGGSIVMTALAPSCPLGFIHIKADGSKEDFPFSFPADCKGFIYEADAVGRDLDAGRKENARMPLSETVAVMTLLDTVRAQGGLVYPQDK